MPTKAAEPTAAQRTQLDRFAKLIRTEKRKVVKMETKITGFRQAIADIWTSIGGAMH